MGKKREVKTYPPPDRPVSSRPYILTILKSWTIFPVGRVSTPHLISPNDAGTFIIVHVYVQNWRETCMKFQPINYQSVTLSTNHRGPSASPKTRRLGLKTFIFLGPSRSVKLILFW